MSLLSSLFDCFFATLNYLASSEEFIALFAGIVLLGSAGVIHRLLRSD